ncbi:NUDIX domain-containing protein [Campylobacterota bacterium]|nr:NUDIX domain-containing protein [Campylobacterota bacterium]
MIDKISVIDKVKVEPLTNPRFVEPLRLSYEDNGVAKSWEFVKVHDSVAVLIYNTDRDEFVIVKQFRPPIYLHNNDGYTYELCAGILDKEKSEIETIGEEIEEETGFSPPPERIERITSFYAAVGFAGSKQTLFFARVRDSDRVGRGGGVDTENIEVVTIKRAEARAFIFDETKAKTSGLAFAFMLFLEKEDNAVFGNGV